MRNKAILITFIFVNSCGFDPFPFFPQRAFSRIHNQSGKDLMVATKLSQPSKSIFFEKFKISNGDSIEISLESNKRGDILYSPNDSVYIYFDDGKTLVFQRNENSPKNFLDGRLVISEVPQTGKYKNNPIDHFFITHIQYELAE